LRTRRPTGPVELLTRTLVATGSEARTGIGRWIGYYNAARPALSFGGRTSNEVYAIEQELEKLAA
jgi:putative transposase